MKIFRLTLENFKGIKNLTVEFNGQSATICGDNGTGKTSIYDAYWWLLFSCDSLKTPDFSPKPENAPKGIESSVTGVFEINGKKVTLKKVLKENWVKQRGKLEAEYSGDVTVCYVNEVPYRVTEFADYIKGICTEDAFKLLSNPFYFNVYLHWQERRKELFEVCGNVSDAEVISSDNSLSELTSLMGEHSIDDFKKILAERRSMLNKRLVELPHRTDEASKSIVEVDTAAAETRSTEIKAKLEKVTTELNKANSGADMAELVATISNLKSQLQDNETRNNNYHSQQEQAHRKELSAKLEASSTKSYQLGNKHQTLYNDGQSTERMLNSLNAQLETSRKQYKELSAAIWQGDTVCPTCKQNLPVEKVEAAKKAFEDNKDARLQQLITDGKSAAEHITALEKEQDERGKEMASINAEIAALDAEKKRIMEADDFKFLETPNYATTKADLTAQIQDAQAKLDEMRGAVDKTVGDLKVQVSSLTDELYAQQDILAQGRKNAEAEERLVELDSQTKDCTKQFEETEKALYLCELFTQKKVSMVTDAINSRFKLVRFKLFDVQKNGAIVDCCEATAACDGEKQVKYRNLNSAMKINVGLDIINTLQQHFNFSPPVFVDNAETINPQNLYRLDSQMIKLRVTEDKQLRVVLDE